MALSEGTRGALDWVESIASLAEALSGEPCTEGGRTIDAVFRRARQAGEELEAVPDRRG
jgi:hypothetical protein